MQIVSARKLVDKLVAECTENIDEVKIAEITSRELQSAENENVWVFSYIICIILAVIALETSIGIGAYFAYSRWYLKKCVTHVTFGTRIQWNYSQTTI